MGNSEKYETKRVSTTELRALREVDTLKGELFSQQSVMADMKRLIEAQQKELQEQRARIDALESK